MSRPSTFHIIVPETRVDVLEVKSEEEETTKKINNMKLIKVTCVMSSMMLPICSLFFTVTFWAFGLIHAFSSNDADNFNMSDCLTTDLA